MTDLSTKLKLYAQDNNVEIDFLTDVILFDDGEGAYIKEWNLELAQPTLDELSSFEVSAQAVEDAEEIQRKRASAYPSIQEQLDMQYWDSVNGTTTWADAIAQVKADYPKGGD